MDYNSYQEAVLNLKSDKFYFIDTETNCDLLHAAIGLVTESAEFIDAIKKAIYYGRPLDKTNLKEELGDVLWYLALGCHALNTNIGEVMNRNIAKLQTRYPDKFTSEQALIRDYNKERKALEG